MAEAEGGMGVIGFGRRFLGPSSSGDGNGDGRFGYENSGCWIDNPASTTFPPRKAETAGSIQTEEPADCWGTRATRVPANAFCAGISNCRCPVLYAEGAEKPQ